MVSLRTRVFQSWFRLSRPMTLGVRAAVENEAGEVFFVRHTYTEGWFMPGGGVERAEPALEALRRELREEGGIALTSVPELFGVYSNHPAFPNDHVLFYRVRPDQWEPCDSDHEGEIAETRWTTPRTPPDGITPGNLRRLKELYEGERQSDYW